MTIAEQNDSAESAQADEPRLRDLFLFKAGNQTFGLPAEEVEGTADAKPPTPLPHAPVAILGVVYARGQMMTLVDPLAVAAGKPSPAAPVVRALISLRGDEQLALAAESISETITISGSDIELTPNGSEPETVSAICGILRHGGEEITILDPARLFAAAVYRKDRRRRRF